VLPNSLVLLSQMLASFVNLHIFFSCAEADKPAASAISRTPCALKSVGHLLDLARGTPVGPSNISMQNRPRVACPRRQAPSCATRSCFRHAHDMIFTAVATPTLADQSLTTSFAAVAGRIFASMAPTSTPSMNTTESAPSAG
jgi:hypothetical protein